LGLEELPFFSSQGGGAAVILGPPGLARDNVFLRLLGLSLSRGKSLVFHTRPSVRVERLRELVHCGEDLLSRALFRRVPTMEDQETLVERLDMTIARMDSRSVFFDSPSDNYLVSLSLVTQSPLGLKGVNASVVKQFAYLKAASVDMNVKTLVTMGTRSGINAVEEYLLRDWPDLVIRTKLGSESDAEFELGGSGGALNTTADVVTLEGHALTAIGG